MISIPQPEAIPNQAVMVENYRTKDKRWETGVVRHAKFSVAWDGNGGYWSYDVLLDRRTASKKDWMGREIGDNYIMLYVGSDGIKAL